MKRPRTKPPEKKAALRALAAKPGTLAADIRQMIDGARQQVAQAVNAGLTVLHWQIGSRIHREILQEKRADYGAEIVSTLSRQLVPEFGRRRWSISEIAALERRLARRTPSSTG